MEEWGRGDAKSSFDSLTFYKIKKKNYVDLNIAVFFAGLLCTI